MRENHGRWFATFGLHGRPDEISGRAMSKLIVLMIQLYRYALSPVLGPACRFYPSCSLYAQEAIARHGAVRGVWLALKRVLRCNPWHCGGHDPVP